MVARKQHSFFTLFLILVLCINLLNVQVVRAEGETPTEPPAPTQVETEPPATEVPTEPPTAATPAPVDATPTPVESTPVPAETEATPTPIAEILTQVPESTEVVVIDEEGTPVPLASEEAAQITELFDPMWCPAGALPGDPGCTTNFSSIALLITDMINNTGTYDENGIIYFVATTGAQNTGASFNLTTTGLNTTDFNTLNDYNITLQGGWNGQSGASATFTGTTNFGTNSITVGASGNPWAGNVTINNMSFNGVSSTNALTVYTTSGDITLSNVDVSQQTGNTFAALLSSSSGDITIENGSTFDGNTSNQSEGVSATTTSGTITVSDTTFQEMVQNGSNTNNGATLSAGTVTLTNVTATNNDGYGIVVNNANLVTLNNVTASNNGTESGPGGINGNEGSGVLVNGNANSSVIINGGTFTGNQEYGVEVGNPANTTIYIQATPTCTGNDSNAANLGCYNDSTVFDNTPPSITPSISGTAGANGWYTSNVTVSWTVTDAESGIKTSNGCTTSNLTSDTTGTTLTCSATNNAQLSNSVSVTIKIDKSAPTASLAITGGTLGANGWYTSNVTVSTTGVDSISGVTCTANQVFSTETSGTQVNGSCTNGAGLVTSASPLSFKLDKTAPTASLTVTAGTAGSNGWYTSNVTVHTAGSDSMSGPVTCTSDQFQTSETTGTTFNGSCTNAAGLIGNASSLVIKLDKTAPSISFSGRTAPNGAGWNNTNVTVTWSCSDSVSGPASTTVSQALTSEGAGQSATGTCFDLAGNSASNTQGGINIDKTAPSLSLPANITAEASSSAGAVVTYSATVTDNLDNSVTVSCAPASAATFPIGDTTVNCSSTDVADNTASGSFLVRVGDTTGPVIAFHADVTAEATSASGASVSYTNPTATDLVDGAVSVTCTPASGVTFPLGDTTVTCNASDSRGNDAAPRSFTVHVVDTTAPVIASHADITVEATSAAGTVVSYSSPATSDAVDGAGSATCAPASGATFPLGNTTVTCNASDSHGNDAEPTTFTVHVIDTTAPVIADHADMTIEATSAAGAPVGYSIPSASDAVDGTFPATCAPASGATFPLGDTTVTCNATDSSGNDAEPTSFVIHVVDTTAPVIAFHGDVTVQATSATGAIASYSSPATSDAVDGAGTATCAPASGISYPLGDTTITCNASDSHGNDAAPTTFVIHVVDTAGPVIASHADITVEATSASGASVTYTNPSATDVVDGPVSVSCAPASGGTFPLGDTTVTCDASDSRGNDAAPSTFVVHVVDTTGPIIASHADITVEAVDANGANVTYTSPSTSDAVDGSGSATCAPASDTTFPLGDTTVTCTAADTSGNEGEPSTFVVHVIDTTAPSILGHGDVTAEATSASGAAVNYTSPGAIDSVDQSVPVTCAPASGATFPLGDTTVTCNAADDSGNEAVATTFVIHVVDTTAPVIAFHADVTVQATSAAGAMVSYTAPNANDAVDGTFAATCAPASGGTFPIGDTTVTCNASDSHGNAAVARTFTIHVIDSAAPMIQPHDDVTVEATSGAGALVNYTVPTANDIVDGAVDVTCNPASGTQFDLGNTTVTCEASDSQQNAATPTTFVVHVVDTTPPAFTGHANMTVEALNASGALVNFINPTATDLVDGPVSVTCIPASGSTFPLGNTTVVCNATDSHANTGMTTFVVDVVDTTAPVIASGSDVTVEATGPNGATATYSTPSASDAVDGSVAVTCTPASGSTFPVGNTAVTCNAMDTHENIAQPVIFTVHVVDTTAPTLNLPANINLNATGPSGAVASFAVSASDTVDTSVLVECDHASGATYPIGTTMVSCTATDNSENQSQGSFFINIMDPEGPILSLPANLVVEATGPSGATVNFNVTASDLIDGSVPVTCTPASGTTFDFGLTAVQCEASDSTEHSNTGSFFVLVQDTTAPAIAPHADFNTTTDSPTGVNVTYTSPTTSDAVDGNDVASCTPASGTLFPIGDTVVTCTITDSHGNSSISTFNVHVELNKPGNPETPTSPSTSSLIIPLTGGDLIDLECDSVLWAFGIKLSFFNLCDYQTTLNSVGAGDLPGALPAGYSFVMGLDMDILSAGQLVDEIPSAAGVEMDFPLYNESADEFTVLFWSEADGQWIEISEQIDSEQISETLNAEGGDELYQVLSGNLSDLFLQTLTTQKTGVFVLVKK